MWGWLTPDRRCPEALLDARRTAPHDAKGERPGNGDYDGNGNSCGAEWLRLRRRPVERCCRNYVDTARTTATGSEWEAALPGVGGGT